MEVGRKGREKGMEEAVVGRALWARSCSLVPGTNVSCYSSGRYT